MSDLRARRAVLIVGGTSEARQLAESLHAAGIPVLTSLAGRTERPLRPAGDLRIGGFGGLEALVAWLQAGQTPAVVDASHPFAAQISLSVAAACGQTGTPLLRLERPTWTEQPGDRWHRVGTLAEAAALVPQLGRRVLLTIGRQGVAPFSGVAGCRFLIRCIEAPAPPLPTDHAVLLARGPYTLADELALLDRHRIDVLVTKDSGGAPTEAKLEAARQRGVPVVVVRRPLSTSTVSVTTVEQAAAWVQARLSARSEFVG
jgi:precorrin-6A/cobalt-precorrin-6A reductase